jgi:hypothetical protein
MLPGVARVPPGRGPPGPAPGRACGRGAGRSTGCCDEKGLLPTRGGRGAPGLGPPLCGWAGRGPGVGAGPGRAPGVGAGPGRAAGAAGAALAAGAWGAAGEAGGAAGAGAAGAGAAGGALCATGAGAAGLGALGLGPGTGEPEPPLPAGRPLAAAGLGAVALSEDVLPPSDSRRRRATGASTVDDADLTNSPCSFSFASKSLLVTPSSLANSCTRALPATTSPVWRRQRWLAPRLGFSYDAWSSGLHGVLMFFATCSLARVTSH